MYFPTKSLASFASLAVISTLILIGVIESHAFPGFVRGGFVAFSRSLILVHKNTVCIAFEVFVLALFYGPEQNTNKYQPKEEHSRDE